MIEVLAAYALSLIYYFSPSHFDLYAPEQVHTAWTESPGELSVMWVTTLPIQGAKALYRPTQCNGYAVAGEWREASASWSIFDQYSLLRWQSHQTAVITGLQGECLYQYKVGAGLYWSELFTIAGRTPDYTHTPPECTLKPATFAVIGDMGIGNWSDASRAFLTDLAQSHSYDALLHLGDIAYNLHSHKGRTGDEFLRDVQPIAAHAPYLVAPGNHEKANNFTHYKARFRMPRSAASGDSNFFFSFDLGPAHVVLLSTELYFSKDNNQILTQQNWLMQDLKDANVRREEVPWIVVMGHKPTYCNIDWTRPLETSKAFRSNNNCYKQSPELRTYIEDILYENKVDLYIGAHVHKYERNGVIYRNHTYPSEREDDHYVFNPSAPVHILTGIAGNDHGPNPLSPTPQLWSKVQGNQYGFGMLRVPNRTHLLWEHYDSTTRKVHDFLTIEKSRPAYAVQDPNQ